MEAWVPDKDRLGEASAVPVSSTIEFSFQIIHLA